MTLLAAMALAGCGPRNFANENDQLRRQNLELQQQVEELQKRINLRLAEIEALRQRVEGKAKAQPGVVAPQFVALRFAWLSGPVDVDGDGIYDQICIYLHTCDPLGRFIPVAGQAVAQVVHLPAEGSPQVLVRTVYEPRQLEQTYRTGLTGTHYRLDLDLPPQRPEAVDQVTVKVTLTDLATGVTAEHEQAMSLVAARPQP